MIVDRSNLFTRPQLNTFQHQIFMYRFFWRTISQPHPPLNFGMTIPRSSFSHPAHPSFDTRIRSPCINRGGSTPSSSSAFPTSSTPGQLRCSFCHTHALISGYLVSLESCHHIFCVPCLQSHIRRSKEPQIPCPYQSTSNCTGYLLDPEIKQYISSQEFEGYLLRSLTSALEGSLVEKLFDGMVFCH